VAIDYTTKWVEAQAFHTNIVAITVKFLYEHILTKFDYRNRSKYPFYQQCYQISYKSFYFRHISSIIYYLQRNGQVESTNKVFGTLLTKLVNEK